METRKIMSGFVDIKSEFLDKYPESGPANELQLSFAGVGEVISVQDVKHPDRSLVLAILNWGTTKTFKLNLVESNRGYILIRQLYQKLRVPNALLLARALNDLYQLCGTYSPRK